MSSSLAQTKTQLPVPDAASASAARIRGVVDSATPRRLSGWADNAASPDERVIVALRLGEQTVAETVADRDRPDLAKAGIGDGRHAFELPLEMEWVERRNEMAVVARAADGTEAPIPVRIHRPNGGAPLNLQRGVEAIAAGQRQLREQLSLVATRLPAPEQGDAARMLLESHRDLAKALDTLTIWLTRLDERLAALPVPDAETSLRRRFEPWQIVLTVFLTAAALGALAVSVFILGR